MAIQWMTTSAPVVLEAYKFAEKPDVVMLVP